MNTQTYKIGIFLTLLIFLTGGFFSLQGMEKEPSVTGHWEGTIQIPGQPLEISIDFSIQEEKLVGDISIPAQKATDLPLENISITDDTISFAISGIPGNPQFEGTLSEDGHKIKGEFTQSGQNFPFEIQRMDSPVQKAKEALQGFDEFIEKALKDWNVPGLAVGVVVEDEVVFSKGFGYRNLKEKLPVTPQTLFAIGSATKAFTTFVLGTLVGEGKMKWDTPVRDYIPDFRMYDPMVTNRITPRDLVTHRSGLPRHDMLWYNNHEYSREELVRRLRYLKPSAGLREKFQYNNLMFLTAGYLSSVLTGKSWEELVRERIFKPLGMDRSNFSVKDSQKTEDYALPYREEEDQLKKIPFREITVVGPAGSINSCVEDMTRWITLHLNQGKYQGQKLIDPLILQDIHSPHMTTDRTPPSPEFSIPTYGLGWFIDTYRGHKRVHHGGSIDGFIAQITLFPEDRIGLVVFANKNGASLPGIVTLHAADRLLELEPIDWNARRLKQSKKAEEAAQEAEKKKEMAQRKGTSPSHPLSEYTGEYEHPGYGTLVVEKTKEGLQFTFNDITTPLEHWHYDVFNAPEVEEDKTFANTKILFRTGMKGYVEELEIPLEPSIDPIVFTKKPPAKYSDPDFLEKFVGTYDLHGQTLSVRLVGERLKLHIPGQPTYTLQPDLGETFVFEDYSIISVNFETDEQGKVKTLILDQPNGRFTAERIDEEESEKE